MTPSGQRFYEKAKELLRLSYQFEQNSKADNELVSGIISIGCFETAAPLYMPSLMAGFKKIYPEITIKIYDGEQHEIAHGLHRGRFDLAFLYDLELDTSIYTEPQRAAETLCVVTGGPSTGPAARRTAVRAEQSANDPVGCGAKQKLLHQHFQR